MTNRRRSRIIRSSLATGAILAASGVMTAGPPAQAATRQVTGTFSALTYNVAGLTEPFSSSEPTINMPLISPLLNDYDLVLTQEDFIDPVPPLPPFNFFHDDLLSQNTHPYRSTPAVPPIGTDTRRPSALVGDGLNQLSNFPFGPVTRVMWDNCFGGADESDGGAADCLSEKGFMVSRMTFANGVDIDIYNLHGEAGSTKLDVEYSADDYAQIAAYMNANSAGHAVIVGGDWNLHTDEPGDGAVFQTFLAATGTTDVCGVVNCGTENNRIDKFVFRSSAAITIAPLTHMFEVAKFTRYDGQQLSDHEALRVDFSYTISVTEPDPIVPTPPVVTPPPAVVVVAKPALAG